MAVYAKENQGGEKVRLRTNKQGCLSQPNRRPGFDQDIDQGVCFRPGVSLHVQVCPS